MMSWVEADVLPSWRRAPSLLYDLVSEGLAAPDLQRQGPFIPIGPATSQGPPTNQDPQPGAKHQPGSTTRGLTLTQTHNQGPHTDPDPE